MVSITLILIAAIGNIAVITGCSNQKNNTDLEGKADSQNEIDSENKIDSESNTNSENNQENDNIITIGFSLAGSVADDNTAMADSMENVFSKKNGYALSVEDAGQDQEKQFRAIRNFIDKDMDYIIAAPLEENEQWETVLSEAEQAEIPVILVGTKIEVANEQLYMAWIGSDYLQEGYDASDWLEDYLGQNERDTEEIQIAMVTDSSQNSAIQKRIQERFQGFLEQKELSKLEHWNVLDGSGTLDGTPSLETEISGISIETAKEMIGNDKKIDVLVCGNDQIALELIETLEKAGKAYGTNDNNDNDRNSNSDNIIIISFGASKRGLEAVRDGKIHVELEQNLSYGPYAEDIVKRLEKGDEIDKVQYVIEDIFTAENAEEKLHDIK